MIQGVLEELGVRITRVTDSEIQAYCPVHHLKEGTEQHQPKWYMNAETGAWICFTCGQRGSLPYLVEALGGDSKTIGQLLRGSISTTVTRWVTDKDGEEVDERILVDPVLFDANPRPSMKSLDNKDIDPGVCARYNARWDAKGKCWLLPIYTFDNQLAGWQEKSKGYFMNVPKEVKKSESLFGWHTYRGGQLVVVESPLDAMRFASYEIPAVATYGSFISDPQLAHLRSADKLVLAFDNDDAGDHARDQVAKALHNHKHLRVFRYPRRSRGKDPGELTPSQLIEGVTAARIPPPPPPKENRNERRPTDRLPRRRPIKVF